MCYNNIVQLNCITCHIEWIINCKNSHFCNVKKSILQKSPFLQFSNGVPKWPSNLPSLQQNHHTTGVSYPMSPPPSAFGIEWKAERCWKRISICTRTIRKRSWRIFGSVCAANCVPHGMPCTRWRRTGISWSRGILISNGRRGNRWLEEESEHEAWVQNNSVGNKMLYGVSGKISCGSEIRTMSFF